MPTITQALHIINGETLNNKLRDPENSVDMMVRLGFSDEQIVDYLYLASYSRNPKASERIGLDRRPGCGGRTEDTRCGRSAPRRAARHDMVFADQPGIHV